MTTKSSLVLLSIACIGLIADAITFYALPPGSEINPLINIVDKDGMVMLKILAILYLCFLWKYLPSSTISIVVYAIGIATGFLGFGANLSVLLAR